MKTISVRRSSLLALSLAAALAPTGCVAQPSGADDPAAAPPEEVGTATDDLKVSDLAYAVVNITNEWNCPNDSHCGMTMAWFGSNPPLAELAPANDTVDLTPWRLVPVPGTTDQFYIRNEWQCGHDSRCDMYLGFKGTTAQLFATTDTFDLNPWKFVKVPNTAAQFYIYNEWDCPSDSRCGMNLGFSVTSTGTIVDMYPASDTVDQNPWKVTVVSPSGRIGSFFDADDGSSLPATSYGRGAGKVPTTCAAGYENSGLLCVQSSCPSGYTDTGLFCTYTAGPATTSCDGWDWIHWHCASCPANYTDVGAFCAADTIAKTNDGSPGCGAGEEEQAGLCYPLCDPGYHGVGPVCWLDGLSSVDVCRSLYDSSLALAAVQGQQAMTFGIGAGIADGISANAEAGVVYGEQGQFGCYTTACKGNVTDVSVSAWGSFDTFGSYSAVAGQSYVTSVGAAEGIAGAATGIITDANYNPVGITTSVSLGVGESPIQLGFSTCQTSVTRLW